MFVKVWNVITKESQHFKINADYSKSAYPRPVQMAAVSVGRVTRVTVSAPTEEMCDYEFIGQLYDGFLENVRIDDYMIIRAGVEED